MMKAFSLVIVATIFFQVLPSPPSLRRFVRLEYKKGDIDVT